MLNSVLLRKTFLGLTLAALAASPSYATVVGAGVSVMPSFHTGACPFTFKFVGKIESDTGGVVRYRWIRSDGATAPIQRLEFRGPGTRMVDTTWELSPAHFRGWEAIRVLSPNSYESNKATFELTCK
jgi:hypothetical protein